MFETVELKNESLKVKTGLVNPEVTAEKERFVPDVTDELGESDWIVTVGGPITTIWTDAEALTPSESVTVTVKLCVPASPVTGIQTKTPELLKSLLDTVVPPNESLTVYVSPPLKLFAVAVKKTSVPTFTELPGLRGPMETDGLVAKTGAAVARHKMIVKATSNDEIFCLMLIGIYQLYANIYKIDADIYRNRDGVLSRFL